jgi:hypothetical protein
MKKRVGQGTLELLILFSVAMLAMAVVAMVLPTEALAGQVLKEKGIARETTENLAAACDEVYLQGEGASKHIWIELPQTISFTKSFIGAKAGETDWVKRKMININVIGEGDIFALSRAPVCGTWPAISGRHRVKIEYSTVGAAHIMVNGNCYLYCS